MFGAMSFPIAKNEAIHPTTLDSVSPATITETSKQGATEPNNKEEIDPLFDKVISEHDDKRAISANGQAGSRDDNDNEDEDDNVFAATPFTWNHIAASHEAYVAAQQQAQKRSKFDFIFVSVVESLSCQISSSLLQLLCLSSLGEVWSTLPLTFLSSCPVRNFIVIVLNLLSLSLSLCPLSLTS